MKSVRIQSYSGPYSVRMRESTDQNNSEYGRFLRSAGYIAVPIAQKIMFSVKDLFNFLLNVGESTGNCGFVQIY